MAVDFSALMQLSDEFADVRKELDDLKGDIVKRLGAEVLSLTIDATPVDSGALRRGWSADRKVTIEGNTHSIHVFNDVPYAEYVEYGHRLCRPAGNAIGWVDGKFMATKSCAVVQNHAEQTAKEVVIRKIKEVLDSD